MRHHTAVGSVGIGFLFAGFVVSLWNTGLFRFTGTDPSAKLVAASLALVGGLAAALVSLLGIILKASIDTAAEQRLKLEADRDDARKIQDAARLELERQHEEARRAEEAERLALEAATRALHLFVGPDGSPSLPIQRAGALFMLSSLGQHDLTIVLTSELLADGQLDPATAARVLNASLVEGTPHAQREAITVLYNHAEKLLTKTGFEFPLCIIDGGGGLSEFVRDWAPIVLAKILLARTVEEWRKVPYSAHALLAALADSWTLETEQRIRRDIGAILAAVLPAFPDIPAKLFTPKGEVDMASTRRDTADVRPGSDVGRDIVRRLTGWVEQRTAAPTTEMH